jgi:hypothetical protein
VLSTTEPPEQPAGDDQLAEQRARLEAKVRMLTAPTLGQMGAEALVEKLATLDNSSRVRDVLAAAVPHEHEP